MGLAVIVIGAGAGGLAAALTLAAEGADVTVLERASAPGGKMRWTQSPIGPVDAGPTVFTMRHVFEGLFARAGLSLEEAVRLHPLETLARHQWRDGSVFDLPADPAAAVEAVGQFAGAREAAGFQRFLADSARIYRTLYAPFMAAQRPDMMGLAARVGPLGLWDLAATRPFETLWGALGGYFRDPRLRQLFARYATYCGANPFAAPATLMLIAHVEQAGVFALEGGMHGLAQAMAGALVRCGGAIRYGVEAADLEMRGGRVAGVITTAGERLSADAVVFNGDAAALSAGALGKSLGANAPCTPGPNGRSLSALVWTGAYQSAGFNLAHHNVFFSNAYEDEFTRIFKHGALPLDPTIYVCAQDRAGAASPHGPERLLILANAPARADIAPLSEKDIAACETAAFSRLRAAGLMLEPAGQPVLTGPKEFAALFPATGGAIYGAANHGPFAAFQRPGARTKAAGLYLAGGSVHPSAGAPMAALSGILAAQAILEDRGLTRPSRPAAIAGGTSTPSPKTGATA